MGVVPADGDPGDGAGNPDDGHGRTGGGDQAATPSGRPDGTTTTAHRVSPPSFPIRVLCREMRFKGREYDKIVILIDRGSRIWYEARRERSRASAAW
ncbi:hypothetical protein GCM10023191_003990 [Actinoallomurus oryzae]|uniref:Transposase n=1 Tax=Actinoallomurus oryzae TaxID=502180 RepID=A0ABP8P721_9ACTN